VASILSAAEPHPLTCVILALVVASLQGVFQNFSKPVLCAFSDEDTVMAGGEAIWHELCPGTTHPGVEHVTINGVGHFLQDGGAVQLTDAILKFIAATPLDTIALLRATPTQSDAAKAVREAAFAAATERAVAHGDVGISTPSDGGKSFVAETPEGRDAYQPTGTIVAAERAQGI
jgi:haloalkane dehalogenase